jgi:RNA polymerase sigma-70 factor, ECF subfamily
VDLYKETQSLHAESPTVQWNVSKRPGKPVVRSHAALSPKDESMSAVVMDSRHKVLTPLLHRDVRPGLPPLTPHRVRPEELQAHLPRLRSVIRRILNDEDDTEDVLQDVMLTALQKLNTFRGDASLGTWLHRIGVNAALAYRRRRRKLAERESVRADDAQMQGSGPSAPAWRKAPQPDFVSAQSELGKLLQQAMAKLPAKYREVFILADVEDLSNEEIGQRLGLKLAAVKSRLHRARRMMRDYLAPHFADPLAASAASEPVTP